MDSALILWWWRQFGIEEVEDKTIYMSTETYFSVEFFKVNILIVDLQIDMTDLRT